MNTGLPAKRRTTTATRVIDHLRQKVYGQPPTHLRPAVLLAAPLTVSPTALIDRATATQIRHLQLTPWANAMSGPAKLAEMVVINPRVDRLTATALAVQAASSLQLPLSSLKIKEQLGRVYLAAFEPQERRPKDPELPMVLFSLGRPYAVALRKLAQQLLLYRDFSEVSYAQRWWVATRKSVDKCIAALEEVADLFTIPELCYMVLMLQAPLAWPRGQREVVPGTTRAGWDTI